MKSRLTRISSAAILLVAAAVPAPAQTAPRPNIVLIVTDDQGYGDLGVHGNPKLQTPHLDRLAHESVRFQSFYVSPVCSPTRASLLTGRYNYRTGVVDTFLGRSLMHADETTIAEMLATAGYRTGIFGKWHLGDNYPLRAMDQGFQESVVLNGGGIGQPSDPIGGESYFDPMLRRNGVWVKTKGYVSDVITDAAIAFVKAHQREPFFAYLAYNAPHTPLEVPPAKYEKYTQMNLKLEDFGGLGHAIAEKFNPDVTAKIYGMVENIDDNVGRVLAAINASKLTERTIVIFMTDNGPQQPRYNAGLAGLKGTVYEGGIRVPLFVRWPGAFTSRTLSTVAAHIDITPTLLDICGVSKPPGVKLDGVSLLPLLKEQDANWPNRTLFFQWHRGDAPELYRSFAARTQRFKLIQPGGSGQTRLPPNFAFQLYDMANDPLEERNVASEHPEIASRLAKSYETWFKDVTSSRDYSDSAIARISLGSSHENPVRLTRQDWRGPEAAWTSTALGHWEVDIRRPGVYEITLRFASTKKPGTIRLALGAQALQKEIQAGATSATFDGIRLAPGPGRLEAWITQDDRRVGTLDVVVKHLR